jgi:hypothetical protein
MANQAQVVEKKMLLLLLLLHQLMEILHRDLQSRV